jgi:flavodoxin
MPGWASKNMSNDIEEQVVAIIGASGGPAGEMLAITTDTTQTHLSRRNLLKLTAAGLLAGAALQTLHRLPSAHAAETATRNPKVLVVYYSLTGNTKSIAQIIQKKTGADLFEIETVKTYPADRPATIEEVNRELTTRELPALKMNPPDVSSYDLILVGSPVWWYTVSTPVRSFLKQADFAGKKVAAFCSHEGGVGTFMLYFKENAKNAVVLEGLDLYKPRQAREGQVDKALDSWLNKLREQIEPISKLP